MCATGGFARERAIHQGGDLLVLDAARPPGTQLVVQTGQPMFHKTSAPFPHGGLGPVQLVCDACIAFPIGRYQDELGARDQRVRESGDPAKLVS